MITHFKILVGTMCLLCSLLGVIAQHIKLTADCCKQVWLPFANRPLKQRMYIIYTRARTHIHIHTMDP